MKLHTILYITESNNVSVQIQQIKKQLTEIQQKLDRLLDGYISGLISPSEYQEKKQALIEQKIELKQKLDSLQKKSTGWYELAKDIILTCNSVNKIPFNSLQPTKDLPTDFNSLFQNDKICKNWRGRRDLNSRSST